MRNNGRWIFSKYEKAPWCTQAVCPFCGSLVACSSSLSNKEGQKTFADIHHFCPSCGNMVRDDTVPVMFEDSQTAEISYSKTKYLDGDRLLSDLQLICSCWSVSPYVSKEKLEGASDMLKQVAKAVQEATSAKMYRTNLEYVVHLISEGTDKFANWVVEEVPRITSAYTHSVHGLAEWLESEPE